MVASDPGVDGLVCVLHSSRTIGRVEVRLRFGIADPFDVGFLVVRFVEEHTVADTRSVGENGIRGDAAMEKAEGRGNLCRANGIASLATRDR